MAKKLTKSKARKILHDKSVHGHPLTDKQRKFFGAVASGYIKAQNGIEGTMGGLTDIPFRYNGAWGGPSMENGGWLDKYKEDISTAQTGTKKYPWQEDLLPARPASESTAMTYHTKFGPKSTATTGRSKKEVKASTEAMGRARQMEKDEEAARVAERKAAGATRAKDVPFTLPTGETKNYDDMNWREKFYVAGKNLDNMFRINKDEESFVDEWLNPFSYIGSAAGSLGSAPYEAKLYDSNLPYVAAVADPLLAGAFGFDPLGGALKLKGKLGKLPIPKGKFQPSPVLSTKTAGNYLKNESPITDDLRKRLITSATTIEAEGNKILGEISSPEGISRLKNQFKLANPDLNDAQLDHLVSTRLNEVNDALSRNQSKFFLNYGQGAPGSPTQGTLESLFPTGNAHWSPYNPYPEVRTIPAPESLFPRNRGQAPSSSSIASKLNLSKPSGYDVFTDPTFSPGSIALGKGLENNARVLDHEIAHAIQKGGEMPIDEELRKLLPGKGLGYLMDDVYRVYTQLPKRYRESVKDMDYFSNAGGRTYKNEAYPFLVEQRRKMIERGILKDRYDKVTPWKLAQARLAAYGNKGRNFVEGDRLIKATPFWKYGKLSKIMNTAPAAVPVIGGAAALANQSEEEVPQYRGGGSMPGSVGFMYARTQEPAPSEGPYAKKTMPSAQDGITYPQLEEMDAIDKFGKEYTNSKNFKRLSKLQGDKPWQTRMRKKIVNKFDPLEDISFAPEGFSYVTGGGKPGNEKMVLSADMGDWPSFGAINAHEYGHLGYNDGNMQIPDKGLGRVEGANKSYQYNMMTGELDDALSHDIAPQENRADLFQLRYQLNKHGIFDSRKKGNFTQEDLDKFKKTGDWNRIQRLYDDKDIIWMMNNIAKNNAGNQPPMAQNGMTFYQHGLDWKPRNISKNGSVVKDDMGYWNPDNWGKAVEISSPDITMQGVYEPLLGVSDTGDTKLMEPGKDYKFKGSKVREYPVKKNGGWLDNYK